MPLHKQQERSAEDRLRRLASGAASESAAAVSTTTAGAIGTTGRGIGPTYASRALRDGPRVCDVVSASRLEAFFARHPDYRRSFDGQDPGTDLSAWAAAAAKLAPFVTDVAVRAQDALARGARVLVEGAQGAMLDVSFGTYPFVTSSSLISGGAAAGLGIPPTAVDRIIGVTKAYATRVGNGPFPGELTGSLEQELRERGHEYGATTGRPRRVGWLDLVALRYFVRLNGVTDLVLIKSDVLVGCDQVGLVTDYMRRSDRRLVDALEWPCHMEDWEDVEPVLSFVPGWTEVLSVDNTISNKALRSFLAVLEQRAGVPVRYVSAGPERSQGVWL
jgi:adenylosuccinate synthase